MSQLFSPPEDYKDPFDLEGSSAKELLTWLVEKHAWVYNDQGAKVFAGPADRSTPEPAGKTAEEILLKVPYYSQKDSKIPGQWWRSCFSSSVAMMAKTIKSGVFSKSPNADDEHLQRVMKHGDTTQAFAQIAALEHYGIKAQFRQDLDWPDVDAQLLKGKPVPIGILIKGHVDNPGGGGHYICVIGKTSKGYIVHDPYGNLDLIDGGYPTSTGGNSLHYSLENLTKRWRPHGSGGWGIIAA